MIKLDEKKLAKLNNGSKHLTEKYGEKGSPSREEFEAKAKAWYYAELLRDERKRQKLTQQQLGERIGKKREYISALEQGQTDMQLSTFMLIANALGRIVPANPKYYDIVSVFSSTDDTIWKQGKGIENKCFMS